ncbi:MAG: PEGA domain-containing protein [Candidatus Omnitrophica bacterium]|nr:PEGA domain-containing protein [Candidatus Omnitrophota bacterium]
MKKILSWFLVTVLLAGHTGCASIVSGKQEDVTIHSEPAGAEVYVDDLKIGTTPMIASLKRKKHHTVKFKKEGYQEELRTTGRGFNWWFTGNLILGGIIGIIVDFATGAVYKVKPQEVNVLLKQK